MPDRRSRRPELAKRGNPIQKSPVRLSGDPIYRLADLLTGERYARGAERKIHDGISIQYRGGMLEITIQESHFSAAEIQRMTAALENLRRYCVRWHLRHKSKGMRADA